MIKNIFLILFAITTIAGGAGSVYFYMQNEDSLEQAASWQQQYNAKQTELNAIGEFQNVYTIRVDQVTSGDAINVEDLQEISIPVSAVGQSTITNKEDLVGKHWKVNTSGGTIVTQELIMDEADGGNYRYEWDIPLASIPVGTQIGDFIDVRIALANGEDYVVLSHKEIKYIIDTTIKVYLTEEELHIWNAAIIDTAMYSNCTFMYVTKYLEPGLNTDTVAFYPVTHEMENLININENIKDKTRCINRTLRTHIDQQLGYLSISANDDFTSNYISKLEDYFSAVLSSHEDYVSQLENGEGTPIGNTSTGVVQPGGDVTVNGAVDNFQGTVNESMDNLGTDLEQMGGIE